MKLTLDENLFSHNSFRSSSFSSVIDLQIIISTSTPSPTQSEAHMAIYASRDHEDVLVDVSHPHLSVRSPLNFGQVICCHH
jgi:hypothetical protein